MYHYVPKSYDRICTLSSVPSGEQICHFKQTATDTTNKRMLQYDTYYLQYDTHHLLITYCEKHELL